MSAVKISILVEPETSLKGKELIDKVIDPEIDAFNKFFAKLTGSGVMRMERELLRAYLYNKLDGKF